MAKNIIAAGYPTTLYNRTRAKAEEVAQWGAKVADTPEAAASGADIVVSCLADPAAVESVMFGADGAIAGLKQGAILIDMSTVDPQTTFRVAEAALTHEAGFLDAPIGGSKQAAADGQLITMVGGDADVLKEAMPVLEVMCRKVIHAGPSGSGTYMKLVFNLVVSHMAAALAEGLVLGQKAGVKGEVILDTLMAGTVASKFYEWKGGCILDRDFSTNFSTRLMHKDLNLIMSAAFGLNLPLPVTASVKELFGAAKATGHADEDFCSVVRPLEEVAGVEVRR